MERTVWVKLNVGECKGLDSLVLLTETFECNTPPRRITFGVVLVKELSVYIFAVHKEFYQK